MIRTTLVGSTEKWDIIEVLAPEAALALERERRVRLLQKAIPEARSGVAAELVFAADQFVITPNGRFEEAARAHARGDEVRTVIAGYHWFTDWGRDTMITSRVLRSSRAVPLRPVYPANLRGLCPRRIDPKHVPGSREGRALSHRGCNALVFFHALGRYSGTNKRLDDAKTFCCRL